MTRCLAVAALAAACLIPPVTARASHATLATPADTVRSFYTYHLKHDMAFTPKDVEKRSRWLAPELVALCHSYFARPTSADEVPPIDGDPFTDSQDTPTSFRVGDVRVAGETATVRVNLNWDDDARSVTVSLRRMRDAWLILDVGAEDQPSMRTLLTTKP